MGETLVGECIDAPLQKYVDFYDFYNFCNFPQLWIAGLVCG